MLETYRTLVPAPKVPSWKRRPISGVAYHDALYTSIVADKEVDDLERWLDREFELPAAGALQKARRGQRLRADDFRHLVRFLAAQDARTPARLFAATRKWAVDLPPMLTRIVEDAVMVVGDAQRTGRKITVRNAPVVGSAFPLRVTTGPSDVPGMGFLKAEVISGRKLWQWSVEQTLTRTLRILHRHRWAVMRAAPGNKWITSDNPVVRLNFNSPQSYDLQGGWGKKNGVIFMPLCADFLIFTQIGTRRKLDSVLSLEHTRLFQKMIAENAHRMIFATQSNEEVLAWRPRVVDREAYDHEKRAWREFREANERAERDKDP
jgi:hypothetical protein